MKTTRLSLADVPVGGCHTLRAGGCPIAVFRPAADVVYAVENRCPHEGYPLSTGPVADGRLTCEWHNWKFVLATGACEIGGEDVRTFPLEVREGEVIIDTSPLSPEVTIARGQASLASAFEDGDFGHAARAVERLLAVGDAPSILAFATKWGAEHAPYGFDHGLAAAADYAHELVRRPDDADLRIVESMRIIVEPNLRRPVRRSDPVGPTEGDEAAFRHAIESEAIDDAEAMMNAACRSNEGARRALGWLRHAATDHFLDYGHAHIYVSQAERLLDAIGWSHASPILGSLTARIAYGTREDRLPYMRAFTKRVSDPFSRLPTLFAKNRGGEFDVDGLVRATVDGTLDEAVNSVTSALESGAAPPKVALALAHAASERLLRFDLTIDASDDEAEGWLDITHALTHAEAVYQTLQRHPSPELLRGLYHSARFIHHLAPLDGPVRSSPSIDLDSDRMLDAAFNGHAILPIFVAHHVKTACAAVRLRDALGEHFLDRDDADRPVAAAAHFLASPLHERRTRRRVLVARRFVRDGEMSTGRLGY